MWAFLQPEFFFLLSSFFSIHFPSSECQLTDAGAAVAVCLLYAQLRERRTVADDPHSP